MEEGLVHLTNVYSRLPVLAALVSIFAGILLSGQVSGASGPSVVEIRSNTDGISTEFSARSELPILSMMVRVVGPKGLVFQKRVKNATTLRWIPTADVLDGSYIWEVRAVTLGPAVLNQQGIPRQKRQVNVQSGSFEIENGILVPSRRDREASNDPSLAARIGSKIIDFLFPSAHAQSGSFDNSVTVSRDTIDPTLALFDPDLDIGAPWWRIRMVKADNSLLEFRYCDFALLGCAQGSEITPLVITRDNGFVGINDRAPGYELQVEGTVRSSQFRADFGSAANPSYRFGDFSEVTGFASPGPNSVAMVTDGTERMRMTSAGNAGFGTSAPTAPLHVVRSDDTFEMLFLEQINPGPQDRNMIQLNNNGGIRFQFDNDSIGTQWRFQAATGGRDVFEIAKVGTGAIEMELDASGNLTIQGALTQGSDVNSKRDIAAVETDSLLEKLKQLRISEWSYKKDAEGVRHIGPMAQDFFAVFGLGDDNTKIAPADMAGIAIAAIQAQQEMISAQAREIDNLRKQLGELDAIKVQLDELRRRLPVMVTYNH